MPLSSIVGRTILAWDKAKKLVRIRSILTGTPAFGVSSLAGVQFNNDRGIREEGIYEGGLRIPSTYFLAVVGV